MRAVALGRKRSEVICVHLIEERSFADEICATKKLLSRIISRLRICEE